MAGINDFPGFISNIIKGSTKDFSITMSKNAEPIDITGCKFYITFSVDQTSNTEPELEIIIDPPTDPTNGKTIGKITDSETNGLVPGTWFYSVRFINSGGDAYVIDMGKIKVIDSISSRIM